MTATAGMDLADDLVAINDSPSFKDIREGKIIKLLKDLVCILIGQGIDANNLIGEVIRTNMRERFFDHDLCGFI